MAFDGHALNHNVNDKGKSPALDAAIIIHTAGDLPSTETCVICLDFISEKAVALPCNHDQFDFSCLGTWIQQSRVCPLCKAEVRAIKYDVDPQKSGSKIFHLPAQKLPQRRSVHEINRRRSRAGSYRPYDRASRHIGRPQGWGEEAARADKADTALDVRKQVYRRKMYSAYVGSNRISRYRNIVPQSFATSADLVSRAKMFIRRELQVFEYLNPDSAVAGANNDRRANNVEFLLEYIVGILKSIDLRGSGGQAEELLKDFLGRENARLFLHELEAWLRSPYERLTDWDKHVQYGSVVEVGESSRRS